MKKVLFVQFANSMFLRHGECDAYWDEFYESQESLGYMRCEHVFEIPKWIAEACYFLPKERWERKVCWVKHDVHEAIDEINDGNYDYVLFSVMTCTKDFTKEIVSCCPTTHFIIGGYDDVIFNDWAVGKNVIWSNTQFVHLMRETANCMGEEYRMGTDYTLFAGETTVPRLTMSYGCYNNCKFCIIPHGKVESVPYEIILDQVMSFECLNFKLIYLDDKTFGQADNYTRLEMLTAMIKSYKPDFEGFIIQTTSLDVIKKHEIFEKIGVKVIEIGMETMNDEILREWRKPSCEKYVREVVDIIDRSENMKLILNVVVGFPQETEETYQKTYDYVMDVLKHPNVIGINPAIYTDYDSEDCQGEIDFQNSDKIALHRKWWEVINRDAARIINSK